MNYIKPSNSSILPNTDKPILLYRNIEDKPYPTSSVPFASSSKPQLWTANIVRSRNTLCSSTISSNCLLCIPVHLSPHSWINSDIYLFDTLQHFLEKVLSCSKYLLTWVLEKDRWYEPSFDFCYFLNDFVNEYVWVGFQNPLEVILNQLVEWNVQIRLHIADFAHFKYHIRLFKWVHLPIQIIDPFFNQFPLFLSLQHLISSISSLLL